MHTTNWKDNQERWAEEDKAVSAKQARIDEIRVSEEAAEQKAIDDANV